MSFTLVSSFFLGSLSGLFSTDCPYLDLVKSFKDRLYLRSWLSKPDTASCLLLIHVQSFCSGEKLSCDDPKDPRTCCVCSVKDLLTTGWA